MRKKVLILGITGCLLLGIALGVLVAYGYTVIVFFLDTQQLSYALHIEYLYANDGLAIKIGIIVAVIIGLIFSLDITLTMYGRKRWLQTDTEKQNTSVLHNKKQAIQEMKLHTVTYDKTGSLKGQCPIGTNLFADKNHVYVDTGQFHSIVIGITASGKTTNFILHRIKQIVDGGESAIILDPKGELWSETAGLFSQADYDNIWRYNLTDASRSDASNPFSLGVAYWKQANQTYDAELKVWQENITNVALAGGDPSEYVLSHPAPSPNYSRAIESWKTLVNTLCEDQNAGQNKIWNDYASDLILGTTIFLAEINQLDKINASSIRLTISQPDLLIEAATSCTKVTDNSRQLLSTFLVAPDKTRESILSVATRKLSLLILNDDIKKITSNNNIDFSKLGTEKSVIFVTVHDERTTYHFLATLLIQQAYEVLIDQSRRKKEETGIEILDHQVCFLCEEFGIFPAIPIISEMLNAGRSRGIRFILAIQGFAQLSDKYGSKKKDDIINACTHKIYLLSGDKGTAEEFSKLAGSQNLYNRDKDIYEQKPLISVDRLNHLKQGEVVILKARCNPTIITTTPFFKMAYYNQVKQAKITKSYPRHQPPDVFLIADFLRERSQNSHGKRKNPKDHRTVPSTRKEANQPTEFDFYGSIEDISGN